MWKELIKAWRSDSLLDEAWNELEVEKLKQLMTKESDADESALDTKDTETEV